MLLPFHDWLVELRRHFHQYPELARKEEKTAGKIAEVLGKLGIPFRTGIGGTGTVAEIRSQRPGPALGLRADMDALPLQEKTDVPYRSRHPEIMHACGHDAHIAIALGTARLLVENRWAQRGAGKIILIFQPAEESGAGASAMLESGIFGAEALEAVFAAHMHPELTSGQIGVTGGISNAASDNFAIRITGKGGHGAHPHLCIDPIVAGAHLVTQIQTIASRAVSPLDSIVVTVAKFHAGSARNIIPEEALLEGTIRTLRPEVREAVLKRLEQLAAGLESAHGVSCKLRLIEGTPALSNDPGLSGYAFRLASDLLGPENVHMEQPRMGAEDFAFFAQRWPALLIRLGCRKPGTEHSHGLHSPWFDLDETVLDVGVRLFAALLEKFGSYAPE